VAELNEYACLIIEKLGGTSKTARLCECEPASISGWKRKGIPKSRLQFLRLARPEIFAEPSAVIEAETLR
jgi:hypothetical protein